MAKALRERVGKQYTGTQRTRKAVHGECTVELAKWTFPIISLCREPYEAKVSRTGLTGGMGRRTVRQRALCLPSKSGSCIGSLRIIHSTQKPATMPSFPYLLWGHCHGTDSLFLPPWAWSSGVCLPHALLAGAQSCRCPSPADCATQATSTRALQGTQTVYRPDPAAAVRPV